MSEADQLGMADFPQAAAQSLAMPEAGHAPGEPLVIDPGFHSTAPAIISVAKYLSLHCLPPAARWRC